jgi:septal ring factor EnvC (AmiA/AmiB activator)
MIDELVATLKQEQKDDDAKKQYCNAEFDKSDDKKKELERSISNLETAIEDSNEAISALKDEIAALEAGIKALDKSVAEATEQRKEENAAFKELMANDSAAFLMILSPLRTCGLRTNNSTPSWRSSSSVMLSGARRKTAPCPETKTPP